jgi:hypothetical protein
VKRLYSTEQKKETAEALKAYETYVSLSKYLISKGFAVREITQSITNETVRKHEDKGIIEKFSVSPGEQFPLGEIYIDHENPLEYQKVIKGPSLVKYDFQLFGVESSLFGFKKGISKNYWKASVNKDQVETSNWVNSCLGSPQRDTLLSLFQKKLDKLAAPKSVLECYENSRREIVDLVTLKGIDPESNGRIQIHMGKFPSKREPSFEEKLNNIIWQTKTLLRIRRPLEVKIK